MSVLLTVGSKCTLAASHAAPEYGDGTDRQTDGRTADRYITLSARCMTRPDTTKTADQATRSPDDAVPTLYEMTSRG